MIKALNGVLLVISAVGFVGVYALKYQAEKTGAEIVTIEKRLERKTELLSTLEAHWAYLNQPSTIEPIVIRHADALGVAPIKGEQFGSLEAIPMRPPSEPNSAALEALLAALEAGIDPTTVASIGDVAP
ncbi:MAG: hypothetical protein WEB63_09695 [Cucumibacter sp.]